MSQGGSIPLAPTKLTDLASQLEHGRQRSVEAQLNRFGSDVVFEAFEAQDVGSGEDRADEGLSALGTGVGP